MSIVSEERATTMRLLTRFLASPEWTKMRKVSGYRPGVPLVACEWDESIGTVMARLRAARPEAMALIAVRRDRELIFLAAEPSLPEETEGDVHPDSSIGMLCEDLKRSKSWSIRITKTSSVRALVSA